MSNYINQFAISESFPIRRPPPKNNKLWVKRNGRYHTLNTGKRNIVVFLNSLPSNNFNSRKWIPAQSVKNKKNIFYRIFTLRNMREYSMLKSKYPNLFPKNLPYKNLFKKSVKKIINKSREKNVHVLPPPPRKLKPGFNLTKLSLNSNIYNNFKPKTFYNVARMLVFKQGLLKK